MWQVNCKYKSDNIDTRSLSCKKKKTENTTKHVLECEITNKYTLS